ncbi:TPA: adhesion domain-containing protein, partial [Vibrio parahaemolyticus]
LSTGTEISDTAAVTFTSMMPTICGGAVNDTDKLNATGNCLKVATDGSGNWFTSSPSIAVMDALGYTIYNSSLNSGKTYASTYVESGPAGAFARFRQDGASVIGPVGGGDGANGQFDRWCQDLATMGFGGSFEWRRPTQAELEGLYAKNGNMWDARGWPLHSPHWSSTTDSSNNYGTVRLSTGYVGSNGSDMEFYASCVSPPPIKICGTGVDDADKTNAAGKCLKVASDAAGNWFTSTPSVALMNELGYTVDNSGTNSGKTYASTYKETGVYGPTDGVFAQFRQDGQGVTNPSGGIGINGQFDRWCQHLAAMEFAGKSTWRRARLAELQGLRTANSDMWGARGWPTNVYYWSATPDGSNYYYVNLNRGSVFSNPPSDTNYASCVSNP